ncbi:MAG: peptidoglycan D,D-transpeptidase FtsI family protein [Porcipelethomonas sp.]
MKEILARLRTAFLAILVVISVALGCVRLMTIQIVNGDAYLKESEYTSVYTQPIKATRGQIVDYNGDKIIENKVGFNVIIDASRFPDDAQEGNEILLETLEILKEHGLTWNDSIPVTASAPYEFKEDSESDVKKLKELVGVNVYATAENCIDKLIDDYKIDSEEYTPEQQRTLAGIRYEMLLRDFSMSNTFTLCEDVSLEVVTQLKELGVKLKGVNIVEDAVRQISQGDVLPHEIGTVGPIFAEEYEELKKKGYAMDDTVGKNGIESAMEDELRGKDGEKTITVTDGQIISSDVTTEAKGGNTVKLTIKSQYQRDVQAILDNFTAYLRTMGEYSEVSCGAVVVLDVEDNSVLAMATSPTYNLMDYKSNYDDILNADNTPLLNRATCGLYRPGSTFKTITATAGLNEGIVTGQSTFRCNQRYEFYDINVGCTGYHNDIAVAEALRVSCNIYFYELSRRLGIDKLSEYAALYGFGQHTGLETGDYAGAFANPETFNDLGADWTVGQVLQAGIGQSETSVTPLQMAVQASTIANRGVRYKPHLVDSIYDYSMTEKISEHEPEVASRISLNNDYVYDYITQGMILASENNFPYEYSLSNLGFDVAIKTGTPQNWRDGKNVTDTSFIGFAPADNPKIAFAGMVESGEYSKYMIRSIIQAYYKNYPESGYINDYESINFLPDTQKTTVTTITDENGNVITAETTETTVSELAGEEPENNVDNAQ